MRGQFHFRGMQTVACVFGVLALSIGLMAFRFSGAEPPPASAGSAGKTPNARDALLIAFSTNLDYSRQWLATKDFKSLGQSAAALEILNEAIGRHTADANRTNIDALRQGVNNISKAAADEDTQRAQTAIAKLPNLLAAVAPMPSTEPPEAVRKTSAGFIPLMHLIDGTFADARTALSTGDCEAAKTYAIVLAELGQYLAADRKGDEWREQADDLVRAAKEIAASKSNDPKQLRGDFHNLYANCEACHQRR